MDLDNSDDTYVRRVTAAYDAMHCPACGAAAAVMAIGWDADLGTFMVAPVFSCDTDGCEFNVEGQSAWIPASTS